MRILVAFLLTVALAAPAAAQRDKQPARPRLDAAADTNDPMAYYNAGMALLRRDPGKAADAFHWAAQLNPGSADAYYARRVALLLARPRLLESYWLGDRRTLRNPDVRRADSLYLHALTINPFFYRKLDADFFDAVIGEFANSAVGPGGDAIAAKYAIETYLNRAPPGIRAWRAYSTGRFDDALRLYAVAIKSARRKASLRTDRGRLFFQLDRADSALAELTLAAAELHDEDTKDLVYVYESKALAEHSIGMVHLRMENLDAAREAFGRALQEDLSYSPAHVQLGFMAVQAKDTATALSELALAAELAPASAQYRFYHAYALHEFGKCAEAEPELRKAIELNPVYASPRFILGSALAAQGRTAEAIAEYQAFLALTSRSDPRRGEAAEALVAMGREQP